MQADSIEKLGDLDFTSIILNDLQGIENFAGKKFCFEFPMVVGDKDYEHFIPYIKSYEDKLEGLLVSNPWDLSLKRIFPDLKFVYSEYGNTFNTETCKLLRDSGADMVILSKELSLEDIKAIKKSFQWLTTLYSKPIEMIMDHCPFSL